MERLQEGIDIIYHELIVALSLFPNDFFAAFDCFDHGVHRPDVGGIVVIVGGSQAGHDAGDPGHHQPNAYQKDDDVVFTDLFSLLFRLVGHVYRFLIHDEYTSSPNIAFSDRYVPQVRHMSSWAPRTEMVPSSATA